MNKIFQKEIDAFREHERNSGRAVYDNQLAFLVLALQRASLAVMEESVGGEAPHHYMCSVNKGELCNCGQFSRNSKRLDILATAKTITSPNTGTLQE